MRFTALLLCLPLFAQEPAPAPEAPKTARIEGHVLDPEGNPVAGATVGVDPGDPRNLLKTLSREDGAFSLDLPPDPGILIHASKTGYLGTQSNRMSLNPGQRLTGITLRFKPGGVISGTVTDQLGNPMANSGFVLNKLTYFLGQPLVPFSASIHFADKQGRFRITGLSSGHYYLVLLGRGSGAALPVSAGMLVESYFRGTNRRTEANPIVVRAGEETRANIELLRVPVFSIRGTLVDLTGQPPSTVTANILDDSYAPQMGPTQAEGQFEISGLLPGTYRLHVGRTKSPSAPVLRGSTDVRVSGIDVTGVILTVGSGATLSGAVRMEEGDLPLPSEEPRSRPRSLSSEMLTASTSHPFIGLAGPSLMEEALALDPLPVLLWGEGHFELEGLEDGPYRLVLGGFPEGVYVKRIQQGSADVTHASIAKGDPLDVLLSTKGATVTASLPAAGFVVALWPIAPDAGSPLNGVRIITSRSKGEIRFTSLPPGSYRIAAFDTPPPGILWKHAFLEAFSAEAASIELAESQQLTAAAPLIPAARIEEEFDKLP